MKSKHIAKLTASFGKFSEAVPSACFLTGWKNIGVLVVISVFAPTVSMNIKLVQTECLKLFNLFCTLTECSTKDLIRSVLVIELGLFIDF